MKRELAVSNMGFPRSFVSLLRKIAEVKILNASGIHHLGGEVRRAGRGRRAPDRLGGRTQRQARRQRAANDREHVREYSTRGGKTRAVCDTHLGRHRYAGQRGRATVTVMGAEVALG